MDNAVQPIDLWFERFMDLGQYAFRPVIFMVIVVLALIIFGVVAFMAAVGFSWDLACKASPAAAHTQEIE